MKGAISQLIMPASGFNWVSYLDKYGIMDDNNTEVIFLLTNQQHLLLELNTGFTKKMN